MERSGAIALPGLESDVVDTIVQRLVSAMHPERIVVFGSHAWGEPTQDSDLDLMVIVPTSAEPPYRRAQRAYAAVGPVGVPKDLLVLTRDEFDRKATVATSLANRVRNEGVVLYELA